MSQGTTFTGRVYLGTNQTTSLSLRAVAGVPSFILGDNAGDQVLSDNGRIYVCNGAAWSPLVNANGGTNMTSALVVGLPSPGPALSASATGSTISTSTATDAYSVTDTAGGGVVARIDTGSGAARITAENTGATKIPLNLEIDALQVNGAAGTSGQVLTSAGPSGAPTWTSPAAAGITELTSDVTAGPGSGSQSATVVALRGNSVSAVTPLSGQVLTYNGVAWTPATAPSGGSGGGILYYLNQNTAPQAPTTNIPVPGTTTTKQLGTSADTPATSVTSGVLSQVGYDLIANFVTDVGTPGVTSIPAGIWAFNVWASSNAAQANQTILQVQVGKYDGSNTPTIIATSNDVSIYDPTVTAIYTISVLIPAGTTLLSTDRLYVAVRAKATQNNRTVTLNFGDGNPSNVVSTIPSKAGGDLSGTYPNPAVVGMGGTATKTLYVIEGGQYATLQAAVNAATANTMILVGPKTTGDWGDVVLNVVDKPLIIAAISGAGSSKIVKTGAITYDLGTSGPVLNANLNEVYLYGLYIQGSFAGSAVTLTGGANYPGRLRLYGCYVLNSNAAGAAAVTNSNAGASSSLYLDGTVVSLSNSTTGSAIVQTAGYTVIRNRSDISGSLAGGATGFAINASAGTVEIYDSYVSIGVARAVATINITGATTFVSAGYSTIYNGSDAAGAACVNVGTSGASFGAGDATLSAGTTPVTAAVAVRGVAGGNFIYTNISFGYTATVSTVTATAFPQSGGLFSFGMSVGSLLAQTFTVSSTGNITKLNNVTTSFPSAQGADTQVLTNNGAGTLSWTNGNRYTLGSIGAAPTAANMRTNATYTVAVAAVALPAMAAGDDGLTVSLLNISGAPSTVTPSTGVARQMTAGGGQTWVWRNTGTSWFCTSNV